MKQVAKYNIYKGVSTAITVGTTLATLICCSDLFIHQSETAISAAGIFAIVLTVLLFKDKIVENWKMPSAFVLSVAIFILILLVENIIQPVKYVCIATIVSSGVDEITFKRLYKGLELMFPKEYKKYKHLGFLFTSTEKLQKEVTNE